MIIELCLSPVGHIYVAETETADVPLSESAAARWRRAFEASAAEGFLALAAYNDTLPASLAYCGLAPEQAALYAAQVRQLKRELEDAQTAGPMKRRGVILAALMRFKQICNHPAQAAGGGEELLTEMDDEALLNFVQLDLAAAGK